MSKFKMGLFDRLVIPKLCGGSMVWGNSPNRLLTQPCNLPVCSTVPIIHSTVSSPSMALHR